MRTKLTIALLTFSFFKLIGQTTNCQDKFLNCKEIVIQAFVDNDTNFTSKLNNQLVQMQLCDPSLTGRFTIWYKNFVANYKTEINNELQNLQNEKEMISIQTNNVKAESNKNLSNQIIQTFR